MALLRGRWILVVLAVVAIGSLWRTVKVEQDKHDISAAYEQAQELAAQLSAERNHLSQELSTSQQTVEGQATEMDHMKQELSGVQERLDQTVQQLASMQRQHEALREQQTSLTNQLSSATQEKEALAAKLSSLKELRVAIRDVKQRLRDDRWAAWRAHVESFQRADQAALASGNRGFIVRNGASTLGAKPGTPRMNVHVLEPQTQ